MGKAFEKQIKTIQDQGKKQVDALENLKPKEQTKPIEDKSNNRSKATIIFDDLVNKRKEIMSELYNSVDYNNLHFEYVGPTEDVSFYEYMDPSGLFDTIRNSRIKFSEVKNKLKEFLNKLSNIKIGKKTPEQKKVINNLGKFQNSKQDVNFFKDYIEMFSDASYDAKQNETKGKLLKIFSPKQMLQRLTIALAQVKACNNSESLLNEIRKVVYYLYQSKQITKKVYDNIIKSITRLTEASSKCNV